MSLTGGGNIPALQLFQKQPAMRAAGQRERMNRKRSPGGFALVASLTLLALLSLLACAILAQIASVNRISRYGLIVTQARQQALIGLDAAMAELQEAMGPDRRISAKSAILDASGENVPPHLLGVWDSWNAPLYGKRKDGSRIRDTYTPGRRSMFRRWLISCRDSKQTWDIDAAARLSSRKPGERICLLGEGSLGRDAPRSHYVYADLLFMPLDGRTQGCFAWWIDGENQKARISMTGAPDARSPMEALRRTWDTPAAMPMLQGKPVVTKKADRLMSAASFALLSKKGNAESVSGDYTASSYSLLTNAAHGGLKQDLCLLLNKDNLDKTEFAPTEDSDAPLVPEQWLPERKIRMPIGSWQTMHAYYNCWPNASQKDSLVTTRLIGSLPEHYTRLGGSEFFQNSLENATEDIVFRPGEVLLFTPGRRKAGEASEGENLPGSNPWLPGYRIGAVAAWHSPIYRANGVSPQFSLGTVLNLRLFGSPTRLTDGKLMAGGNPACMTIANGFGGISSAEVKPHLLDPELPDISSVEGKHIHSPQRFLLDWYGTNPDGGNRIVATGLQWYGASFQNETGQPYNVASLGIVAKSADASAVTQVYPDIDFRTKLWQHSSPAFWGASLSNADHQQRQYHPYQLAMLPVGGGMMASPVPSMGRNGVLGVTNGGEQVSFASVLELPVHPPFSLAGFAGMRLQPGWFRGDDGACGPQQAMQRMQYQSGVPGVGIGNAFADPCLPPDKVYCLHSEGQTEGPGNEGTQMKDEFYDHALLINDALWDRWFCSSVSDMPGDDGKHVIPAQYTLKQFLNGRNTLPVSRYVRAGGYDSKKALNRIMQGDGWKIIAAHLMVSGGFNVNSTSVTAWNAVLQGLASRKLVTDEGGRLRFVEPGKRATDAVFSRFMLSTTDKSTDSVGSYSPMQGSAAFRSDTGYATTAWSEVRLLRPADIRKLAEEMVRQVRERGPFLNMSDFINRRLDEKGGEHALKGALQAAIDRTDINRDFREVQVSPQKGSLYKFPQAEKGDLHTAAPGYLIQSDVLASLGNILTVRDDTFTIRAYGCVRNDEGAVLSQCWCEATVQRTIDYVDPRNESAANPARLTYLNQVFGRRFRVTSFKWLDHWDL